MNTDSLFSESFVRSVGLLYIEERRAELECERLKLRDDPQGAESRMHAMGKGRGLRIALRALDAVIDATETPKS